MGFHSRRTKTLGAALFAGLLGATTAFADVRPELGVFFGALFPDEELTGSQQDGNDVGPLIGLRGGLRLSDWFGLFADGIYSPIDASLPIEAGVPAQDASETAGRGGIELYGPPRWGSGESFIAGAGGVMHAGFEDAEGFTKPLASLGVGQAYKVSDHGRFRWEVRGDHIFVGDDEVVDDDMNQVELLIGGSYMFGSSAPKDEDGDGVTDDLDACPATPAGWNVDSRGCPLDGDGDGVPDGKDRCPGTPQGATVDANGCPSDSDLDGVFDGVDKCPNTLAGVKVDANGCPLDSDFDGVPDGTDKCPGTPRGSKVDANGCPEAAQLFTPEKKTLVLKDVNFETNSAKLTADSKLTLDKVAESLKAYPDVRVEIGGHTDEQGDATHNYQLSQQRAQAVMDYLQARGVDGSQLKAKGYGEKNPVASNDTKEGRAENRRVELKKID